DYVRTMAARLRERAGDSLRRPAGELAAHTQQLLDNQAVRGNAEDQAADAAELRLDALIASAKALLGANYALVHRFALEEQLADCRQDLEEFGVRFDCWFSEQSLYDRGAVAHAVARLEQAGHVYT